MYARVTDIEIDATRATVGSALDRFEREVLPALQGQPGYRGVFVLATPEGKAMLMSLWNTEAQAEAGAPTGFYPETLAQFVTLFAAPPGRGRYEVVLTDAPAADTS